MVDLVFNMEACAATFIKVLEEVHHDNESLAIHRFDVNFVWVASEAE